jgi:hypothetical protein
LELKAELEKNRIIIRLPRFREIFVRVSEPLRLENNDETA